MTKIVCDNCGLEFERKPCKIERAEKHYCSKNCRYEGQNKAKRNHIIKGDSVFLEVTRKKLAILDLIDQDLAKYNWQSQKNYVNRKDREGKYIYMHRIVLERELGITLKNNDEVDHINGNRLDNRSSNLRLTSHLENCANIRKSNRIGSTTNYKGVSFIASKNKYRVRITAKGVTHHLGFFNEAEDAAREYDRAAIIYFGQNAKLNFPWESYALETHRLAGSAMA